LYCNGVETVSVEPTNDLAPTGTVGPQAMGENDSRLCGYGHHLGFAVVTADAYGPAGFRSWESVRRALAVRLRQRKVGKHADGFATQELSY
jgi:hypothetical protein